MGNVNPVGVTRLVKLCKAAIDCCRATEGASVGDAEFYNGRTDVLVVSAIHVLRVVAPAAADALAEYMSAAEESPPVRRARKK